MAPIIPAPKAVQRKLASPGLIYFTYAVNLFIITWFWWRGSHVEAGTLHGWLIILGRYTGLISAYAALWQLLLIGRMPVIKQALGMEQELKLHRLNGYAAIYFLLAHIAFSTIGYALSVHVDVIHQFVDFIFNYQDVLKATLASALMIGLVIMSVVIVRRHFKYETWYLVHLSSYLAIVLGFGHQLSIGSDFIIQPGFRQYWWALYILTFGLINFVRLARPLSIWLWQDWRVTRVIKEAEDIYSIYVTGRHIHKFRFEAGQFAIWHFLINLTSWQGHPFSFSVAPGSSELRLTFKNVGDYTSQLKKIIPGTRVIIEGPFGNFTANRLRGDNVVMIAGGIGLTPIISMLAELSKTNASISVIYAARHSNYLALRHELDKYAALPSVEVHYLFDMSSTYSKHKLRQKLRQLVPDIEDREVFLCGPIAMMSAVTGSLVAEGVSMDHIYTERFSFHSS